MQLAQKNQKYLLKRLQNHQIDCIILTIDLMFFCAHLYCVNFKQKYLGRVALCLTGYFRA